MGSSTPLPGRHLFTVPIAPSNEHPGGTVVCSETVPAIYLLIITSPPDNRLTGKFCQAIIDALDRLEFGGFTPGVVISTSGVPRFYCNGLNLDEAMSRAAPDAGYTDFWSERFYAMLRRLLIFPMPTVAWINGHAFAGGLMLAMHHDYRIMNPAHGFACLNELDLGLHLKPAMASIFRSKLVPDALRSLVLEARRLPGPEAHALGVVDATGGWDEVMKLIQERTLTKKAAKGNYGLLRAEMYRDSLAYLSKMGHARQEIREKQLWAAEKRRRWVGERLGARLKAEAKL